MEDAKISILYIDDEENNLNSFKAAFRREFNIHTGISAAEGIDILGKNDVDIIITDQRMPEMTGVEFLAAIIKQYPDTIRILLTGYADIDAVIDAVNKGKIYQYISKPWDENQLRVSINNSFEVLKLRKDNEELLKKLLLVNSQLEFVLRQKLLS